MELFPCLEVGRPCVGVSRLVAEHTYILPAARVRDVLQTEIFSLLSEGFLAKLTPEEGVGGRTGLGLALNLQTGAHLHLLESLQGDAGPVQDTDVEVCPGHLAEVVVRLAGVEPLVPPTDGGDDVPEGGGDVAPGQGPLDAGHLGVGVHL